MHWRLAEPAIGNNLSLLNRARKLATALVGGDPSNVPIVHPIRWPGSWHRKGEPRLCEIETADPDREIVLEWRSMRSKLRADRATNGNGANSDAAGSNGKRPSA